MDLRLRNNNEIFFRDLYDNLPIAVQIFDNDGSFIDCNKGFVDLFGVVNKNELVSTHLFDDPNLTSDILIELKDGKEINYNTYFDFAKVRRSRIFNTTKTGKILISVSIKPAQISFGNIDKIFVVSINNIASFVEIDPADQSDICKGVYAPIPIFLLNKNGRVIHLNDIAESFFKSTNIDPRKASSFTDILSWDTQNRFNFILNNISNSDMKFDTCLIKLSLLQTEDKHYLANIRAVYDNNVFLFYSLSLTDISDCAEYREKVSKLTPLIETLSTAINSAVLICNPNSITASNKDKVIFTDREKVVLNFLKKGVSTGEIAALMNLSEPSIKKCLTGLFRKTNTYNKVELLVYINSHY